MNRLNIYLGGTFDPIHNGHLAILQQCANLLDADRVFLVPTGRSYQKSRVVTQAQARLIMCELALNDWRDRLPVASVSRLEIDRDGPSYTIDTLINIRKENKLDSIAWIIGEDQLYNLYTWKSYKNILDYSHLIVCARPNFEKTAIPKETQDWIQMYSIDSSAEAKNLLKSHTHGKIWFNLLTDYAISSTQIRNEARDPLAPLAHLPQSVATYIRTNQLYS